MLVAGGYSNDFPNVAGEAMGWRWDPICISASSLPHGSGQVISVDGSNVFSSNCSHRNLCHCFLLLSSQSAWDVWLYW